MSAFELSGEIEEVERSCFSSKYAIATSATGLCPAPALASVEGKVQDEGLE